VIGTSKSKQAPPPRAPGYPYPAPDAAVHAESELLVLSHGQGLGNVVQVEEIQPARGLHGGLGEDLELRRGDMEVGVSNGGDREEQELQRREQGRRRVRRQVAARVGAEQEAGNRPGER